MNNSSIIVLEYPHLLFNKIYKPNNTIKRTVQVEYACLGPDELDDGLQVKYMDSIKKKEKVYKVVMQIIIGYKIYFISMLLYMI